MPDCQLAAGEDRPRRDAELPADQLEGFPRFLTSSSDMRAERAKRYLKAELKRAEVPYGELAERLKKHGLEEIEASIANQLSRGTFAATFFLATLAAIGCEAVQIEDL